ncbi:U-scoloptoxin(19)-Sm1a [Anabrus simplex]|uniref:U-scoloptoxin(19)-Sm1a n=1 Tax=Anabrus simplex TaxID=316456 RepID=UPI0034DD3215
MTRTTAILLGALFSALLTSAAPADEVTSTTPAALAPVNTHEEPCLKEGGLCLLKELCPRGQLSEKQGLCPEQQARGVECCHGLSELERRCSARGGICRPKLKCGRQLWEEKGEDCAAGETCCILVT